MIRKLPHILAIFGVVCFVLILNHVKTSEKNKGIRLLRIAEETEKRIKLEYERKLNDLKRKELNIVKSLESQTTEDKVKKDLLERLKADETLINDIIESIKNFEKLKQDANEKLSKAEKRYAELKNSKEIFNKHEMDTKLDNLERKLFEIETEIKLHYRLLD